MAESNYRIKIVRSGEEFEVQGDKKFVLEMLKRYESRRPLSPSPSEEGKHAKDVPSQASSKGKSLSIGEFIRNLGFKKHTDIVLAFGYYLETYSGLKQFAPADINTCYYDAKMEASNTSQMIIQNIKRGYMMGSKKADKGDKRYTLTQTGVDFINKFKK